MKILFLHRNFPAQFRHLAALLARDPKHQVVFITARPEGSIQGVRKVVYSTSRTSRPETHYYVRPLEDAVLHGQAVYRIAHKLKKEGFTPDVVYGSTVPAFGERFTVLVDVFKPEKSALTGLRAQRHYAGQIIWRLAEMEERYFGFYRQRHSGSDRSRQYREERRQPVSTARVYRP